MADTQDNGAIAVANKFKPLKVSSPIGDFAVGAGLNMLGSLFQGFLNKRSADRAYRRQKQLVNMQNDYNTPLAQKMRMQAAGYNPNIFEASANQSASPSSVAHETYDNPLASGLSAMAGMAQMSMQTNYLQSLVNLRAAQEKTEQYKATIAQYQTQLLQDTINDKISQAHSETEVKKLEALKATSLISDPSYREQFVAAVNAQNKDAVTKFYIDSVQEAIKRYYHDNIQPALKHQLDLKAEQIAAETIKIYAQKHLIDNQAQVAKNTAILGGYDVDATEALNSFGVPVGANGKVAIDLFNAGLKGISDILDLLPVKKINKIVHVIHSTYKRK